MNNFPKFLLDSGNPDEFREIAKLAKENESELWGATTNPTLIAKKLAGKKVSKEKAFELQKEIILEIIDIIPGAVSAEVYADETTTAQDMVEQGRVIATWHERVVVKLPTTIEGFKARTVLRKEKAPINNTLVFSQQQIFAVCIHERIMSRESTESGSAGQETIGPIDPDALEWPPFISPFVGRLDDRGEDGMSIVEHGMEIKKTYSFLPWIIQASTRKIEHIKRGIKAKVELITAPAKVCKEWFTLSEDQREALDERTYAKELSEISFWNPPPSLLAMPTVEAFLNDITSGALDISHPLTDAGLVRFAQDWKAIIAS